MVLEDASVLITGGTGSFGQCMTKRLLAMPHGPARVAILSRDEVKQSEMRQALGPDERLRFFLGDVRDVDRLRVAFRGVDVIFHAAALKRIECCSYDPTEAIATNIKGSINVLRAAETCGVRAIVALSSDKACAPSTTYGATKLCMEHVFTASASMAHHSPVCSVIRYGNVAGSRGSVIPTWRKAIAAGESVLIFDRAATRFWFTLPEAVDFALWALENATGGEVFVPRLKSFRVVDLASALGVRAIDAECLNAPRPGEKRHEFMVSVDEAPYFREWRGRYVRFIQGTEPPNTLDGFAFGSGDGPHMTVDELREALRAV